MATKLSPSIITLTNLADCLRELRQYQKTVQDGKLASRVGSTKEVEQSSLSKMATDVLKSVSDKFTEETTQGAINYLEQLQKQAPVLHLTLASELPTTGQAKVAEWFRSEGNPETLLSFSINPQIGGGVVVRTPYHLHDYSYAAKLGKNKAALEKVIANV